MRLLIIVILVLTSKISHSQSFEMDSFFSKTIEKGQITGVILDKEANNEPLAFATILVKNTATEFTSNVDGSFSINLKPGIYNLSVSFIGYQPIEINNVEITANNTVTCNTTLSALKINPAISLASIN